MRYLHRFFAALLLLAYASTGTSLVPAVAMVLSHLGGNHEVRIHQSDHGVQVVLHHTEHDYTPDVADHASPVTRLIVRICRPDAEGDHSLSLREVGGNISNSSNDTKRDIKSAPPLISLDMLSWVALKAKSVRRDPGRAAWGIFRGGCRPQGHSIVGTTQLLI